MSNYFDEGHKKSQIDTRRMTESEGNESEIILWLKENKLCGKNDCILNIFRENIDYNLPINDFIELLDTNNLKEFLEAINIPKPSIILISSKMTQMKKENQENENKSTKLLADNNEKKQVTVIEENKNFDEKFDDDFEILDLDFEWKFPKRRLYIEEFLDVLNIQNNLWKPNSKWDSEKNKLYNVETSYISTKKKKHLCKYGLPIARSIAKVSKSENKRSLIEIFQFSYKRKDSMDHFYRWKRPIQNIHIFNPFERITQVQKACQSSGAADRDFIVYETTLLLDASNNQILPKDKYIIKNKEIYSSNDKQFTKPLNVKYVWLVRSLEKNDKYYKTVYDKKCERGHFYRSGYCVERCHDSSLKITTIFEYAPGGSWVSNVYFKNVILSICDCIEVSEKLKAYFHL
eukprot:40878_1